MEQKESKALEICSLVFGIISLCGCCYGIFGITGLVLSIVAFAKGKKSGLSIAGMICSIIGLIITVIYLVFVFTHPEFLNNYMNAF